MPKSRHRHPFAVPGDNGTAYLEWGAVPECLRGEVTGLMCAAYRKHASSRTPDARRQTFPGWQQAPASSSSSPLGPPGLALALAPQVPPWDWNAYMSPGILTSFLPPRDLGHLVLIGIRGNKAAVLSKSSSSLKGPGTLWGGVPNLTPSTCLAQPEPGPGAPPQWTFGSSHETRGPCYADNARCFRSTVPGKPSG